MKFAYPVILSKDGNYMLAFVPDCDIDTQGETLVEAIEMARDAISLWCVCEQDAGREVPLPSELPVVPHHVNEIITLVDVDIDAYRCRVSAKKRQKILKK